jgi:hypothetical protein
MKLINFGLLLVCVALLSGCATASFIESAQTTKSPFDKALIYKGSRTQVNPPLEGEKQYRIFHRGATGFTPQSAVRKSAMNRVNEFCEQKGKVPYIIEETRSRGWHVLGNWPRAEFVFSCVDDPQRKEEKITDKYEALSQLKELLDDGAIIQKEYQNEKRKLLTQ